MATYTAADNFKANLIDLAQALQHILENGGKIRDWETVDEYLDIHGNVVVTLPFTSLPPDPRQHADTVDAVPRCYCVFAKLGRPMLPVVSRSTSNNAINPAMDTPVWWCADCHRQVKRETAQ